MTSDEVEVNRKSHKEQMQELEREQALANIESIRAYTRKTEAETTRIIRETPLPPSP